MEQAKSFKSEIEETLAKQALALNYEYGMTSRIMATESAQGTHMIQLMLDLTHSSLDFDMVFIVRFADEPSKGITWELVAPDNVGGKVWTEVHRGLEDFKRAVAGLPFYVQGFFAGRAAKDAVATQTPGGG
jgi:hypothetical protein